MFIDRSTVANADTHSNRAWSSRGLSVSSISTTVAVVTTATPRNATARARRCAPPFRTAPADHHVVLAAHLRQDDVSSRKNAVTLMPPAVPALPPPMDISTLVIVVVPNGATA